MLGQNHKMLKPIPARKMLGNTALNIVINSKKLGKAKLNLLQTLFKWEILLNENAFLKRAGDWLDDVTQRVPLSTNQIIPHEGASVSP